MLSICAAATLTACDKVDRFMTSLDPRITKPDSHLVREPTSNALINDCPDVKVVEELSLLTEFTNPALPTNDSMISRAHLALGQSTCTYTERSVSIDVRLSFESELGPRAKMKQSDTPFVSYPFFVAVTDDEGRILAKEVFAASMTFGKDETRHTYTEALRHVIPIYDREDAREHKVLVGFQLTSDQLAFNRRFMAMHSPIVPTPMPLSSQPYNAPGAPVSIMPDQAGEEY